MTQAVLPKCKTCGRYLNVRATECSDCGARVGQEPKKAQKPRTIDVLAAIGVLSLLVILAISERHSDPLPEPSQIVEPASQPDTPPAPEPKPDPAVELATANESIAAIEERVAHNASHLKKYYASANQVKQSAVDVVLASFVKTTYAEATRKELKALSQRAAKLLPGLEQQTRQLYASLTTETFVKNGMDIQVSATGHAKTQLRISYVLMSQPLVYQFQNDMKISQQAIPLGFKKIIFTNGFNSSLGKTWTVDL